MKPKYLFTVLVVFGLLFFTSSCQAPEPQEAEKSNPVEPMVGISQPTGAQLIHNWQQASNSNIWEDFYSKNDTAKVLTFRLKRASVNTLVKQYNDFMDNLTNPADSLHLQINMALIEDRPIDTLPEKRTNYQPILEFATTGPNVYKVTDTIFVMRNTNVDILQYLDSLINSKKSTESMPDSYRVSLDLARDMIMQWDTTAQDRILALLYEGEKQDPVDRIRYYTFDAGDTHQIFKHLHDHQNNEIYLHLGVSQDSLDIPLCTIIHLDDPSRVDAMIFDPNDPPFFEFASPCPKACGNQSI